MHPPKNVDCSRAIQQAERDERGGLKGTAKTPTQKLIAVALGLAVSTYNLLRRAKGARTPSLPQAMVIACRSDRPIDELPDPRTACARQERDGIRWKPAGHAQGGLEQSFRTAACATLRGESLDDVRDRILRIEESRDEIVSRLDEGVIRARVQGAFHFGLVHLTLSETRLEIEDNDLAKALSQALAHDAPEQREPTVHVVRNLADKSFGLDPLAAQLVALVGHRVVANFISEQRLVYGIGIAGGLHCYSFVSAIGGGSSPYPRQSGENQLRLVPLTMEPFYDHGEPIANAVVAEFARRSSYLLGPKRVKAPSFQQFGYMVNGDVPPLDPKSIVMVRQEYNDLDIAIYGCGNRATGGWLNRILDEVGYAPDSEPFTDVCLNLLSETGEAIPLPEGREFVSAGLHHIRQLAASDEKLALLLTSGAAKGAPLVAVHRAGCASTIICDQAAAEVALSELGRSGTRVAA